MSRGGKAGFLREAAVLGPVARGESQGRFLSLLVSWRFPRRVTLAASPGRSYAEAMLDMTFKYHLDPTTERQV